MKLTAKYNFLEKQYTFRLPNVISMRHNKFWLFNFDIDNYSFFSSFEIVVGKNVN